MRKWIKGLFVKKDKGFTGFRVEVYRDGQLLVTQKGGPDQILVFNSRCGPMIMDGVRVHGYTLTPHLEGN
jgi:hypothetical protein